MKIFLKHSEFKKLECCMALFPFLYTFFYLAVIKNINLNGVGVVLTVSR